MTYLAFCVFTILSSSTTIYMMQNVISFSGIPKHVFAVKSQYFDASTTRKRTIDVLPIIKQSINGSMKRNSNKERQSVSHIHLETTGISLKFY